jgi:hypothetical protein
MANPVFTVEAYYADGALQAQAEFQVPDLTTAIVYAHRHCTWAAGFIEDGVIYAINPYMAVGLKGGVLIPVRDVIEAAQAPAQQVAA